MSKTQRLSLIAALVFFSAFSLPRSSDAGSVSSAWIGVESFNTAVYQNGQLVSQSSGFNVPAEMDITFNSQYLAYAQLSIRDVYGNYFGVFGPETSLSLTPYSASGFILEYGSNSATGANFDLTFQSIRPDGSLDTSFGYAYVYMGFDLTNIGSTTETKGSVSFQGQGLPEPSSFVLAATASLVILIFGWTRGFFHSRPPTPAPIPLT